MTARFALILAGSLLALTACSPGDSGSSSSSSSSSSSAPASDSGASSSPPPSSAPPPSAAPPASSGPTPASFTYNPPGQLQAGGAGVTDATNYDPGIRFPIEQAPAYPNSQVWGHGGMNGPGGDQCDAVNYAYPWSDDFCETRSYSTPMCPSSNGHQGDDIRPSTCEAAVHPAVAVEDGVISQIGTYTVYLSGNSGRLYLYLHMQMNKLKVSVGDHVSRGQELGLVSDNFGSSSTTIHLHFEIKEAVTLAGQSITTNVPPYSSLIDAYQRLLSGHP
jgi:murein DD-endopeptidase MepM/ murein hydrolase activator NlpD